MRSSNGHLVAEWFSCSFCTSMFNFPKWIKPLQRERALFISCTPSCSSSGSFHCHYKTFSFMLVARVSTGILIRFLFSRFHIDDNPLKRTVMQCQLVELWISLSFRISAFFCLRVLQCAKSAEAWAASLSTSDLVLCLKAPCV